MSSPGSPDVRIDLEAYSINALRSMLRARSDSARDARVRGELVAELRRRLFDVASIRHALDDCDRLALEALWLIRQKGDIISVAALRGQLTTWHPDRRAEEIQRAPHELVRRALAFWRSSNPRYGTGALHETFGAATNFPHLTEIFSTPQILDQLPEGIEPPVPAFRTVTLPPGDPATRASALRLVVEVLRGIEERGPRVLRSGVIAARDRRALAMAILPAIESGLPATTPSPLTPPDQGELVDFYRGVLEAARLIRVTDDRRLQTTELSLEFVGMPQYQQIRVLLEAWLRAGENLLSTLGHLEWQRRSNAGSAAPTDERAKQAYARIVEVLRDRVRPGCWYGVGELSQLLRYLDVEFLVPWLGQTSQPWTGTSDRDQLVLPVYSGITLQDSRGRSRWLRMGADWDLVEGAFVGAVIRGPLRWLGLVDAHEITASRELFALTKSGARALGVETTDESLDLSEAESNAGALVVQPNFDLVVYDPQRRPELLYQIDRLAERISVDRLALYRLTREAFCAGLQIGVFVDDAIALLERASRSALPRNVEVSLRDWARQFESVRWVRNACLLEAPTEPQLDRWLALAPVGKLLDRRLAPTFALLRGAELGEVQTAIQALGAEARTIDANDPLHAHAYVRRPSDVVVDPGDLNLFLRASLARIGESGADASDRPHFRLTSASVAAGLRAGLTVGQILGDLEILLGGHLPPGLRVRIKGWGGSYDAVRLSQVVVVTTTDVGTLRELRADPDLGRLVLSQIASTSALVRLEDLDELAKALAARGIHVETGGLDALRSSGLAAG
jgi:hypothetical protein